MLAHQFGKQGISWTGNVGLSPMSNTTALSGTWRALSWSGQAVADSYCTCNNLRTHYFNFGLYVRVS
jgi:hypothetical protein